MKFLIIDDDVVERSLTIETLRNKFTHADIVEVGSREAFDEKITGADFDLAITEYKLGWTDGLTLFKELQSRNVYLPVIMLTGYGNEDVAATAIKCGMADYVIKRNRHSLPDAVERSLLEATKRNYCKEGNKDSLLCERWDLAISRLTSDFAYSMRISPDGKPIFEWVTEPFKRFIGINCILNRELGDRIHDWGLPIHPDDLSIVQHRFEKLLEGFEDTTEYRIITNEDKIFYFSDHALPIRDWRSGKVVRIYGAIQDITSRRNVEDKLNLMQHAIDSSINGIIITGLADTDYAIVYANEAFLQMSGYSMQELLGRNCRILQNNDKDQPDIAELRAALESYRDAYAILRNYRKDGSLFWNEVYISPIHDKRGRITHYVGVQNDVTHRIEMEDSLSKSEARMRSIFNNVSDGIIIIDDNGIIESLNPSFERLFGYSAEELIGHSINNLMPEPDRSRHNSYLTNYLNSRKAKIIGIRRELNGLRKDGSIFSMELGVSELYVDQRHFFIGTARDITERKHTEEALRKSEERYMLVERAINDGIWDWNILTGESYHSPRWLELLGYQESDLPGAFSSFFDLVHPDDKAVFSENLRRHQQGNAPFCAEIRLRHKDGSYRWILSRGDTIRDKSARAIRMVGSIIDITDRKQHEEALRNLSSHLVSAREAERTRIAREVHDQLGSILAVLKMDLSWLAKQIPEDLLNCHKKVAAMNRHLKDAIQSVRKIITDLRPSILDDFGLLAAIEWKIDGFRQQTGMQCVLTEPKDDIVMDKNRDIAVFRIMQEALTNITLHSGATKVTIDVETGTNKLIIKITDNGCGMTKAQMHNPGKYGILGMHERVRHLGGDLAIVSSPGKGTTLVLNMPLNSAENGSYND
ncbi:MAG: PAS domain S-box protein [Methylobacter sp.]